MLALVFISGLLLGAAFGLFALALVSLDRYNEISRHRKVNSKVLRKKGK